MSNTLKLGRLCNCIIRNVGFSLIAKQHNLHVSYAMYKEITQELGILLFIGTQKYKRLRRTDVNHRNYKELLTLTPPINYNLSCRDWLQTQSITDLIYKDLRGDTQKSSIMKCNPFKDRYNTNDDLFIHIRLGDVEIFNPGIEYYVKCIQQITFTNLYISTDTPEHSIIVQLQSKYPNLNLIKKSPIQSIQFGSTCKYIVLSGGTFSAVIGYLGFFTKEIYYSKYGCKGWTPEGIFTNKSWIEIC